MMGGEARKRFKSGTDLEQSGSIESKRIAILASGQGTNLANIYEHIQDGRIASASIGLVLSNNSTSGALDFARQHALPHAHWSLLKAGGDEQVFARGFLDRLTDIDLIVLAGYMKMLPETVVSAFSNRIVNVHPSLLPLFGGAQMYGIRVHQAVIEAGCKVSGATVHLVTARYDEGPILLQKCCAVKEDDTPERLQRRVAKIEYELLPRAIDLLAAGKVSVDGRRARIN